MGFDDGYLFGLLAALGGGLMVGVERERRKGIGPTRGVAGVRTYTLAALLGAVAAMLGTPALLLAGAGLLTLVGIGYLRTRDYDPGLTSEIALLLTYLLGALAVHAAQAAAALFVLVTILLAGKQRMHRFVRQALSERELREALILAASVLIVLPLLPDRAIDPFGVLSPRRLWLLAVLVMAINAAGYAALRVFGPGLGLPLAGLAGGFVSSAATIAGMGQRAREHPALLPACVAGAMLSNVATVVLLAIILAVLDRALLARLAPALAAAGAVAVLAAAAVGRRARGTRAAGVSPPVGRAFRIEHALLFAAIVAVALLLGAWVHRRLGDAGAVTALALAGFADTHAATVSAAQLAASGELAVAVAASAVLAAFGSNALLKIGVVFAGGRRYALPLVAAIVLMNVAAWATFYATG
ncbi:MAG: DUF4010 domain-containing protein [Mizugakiibacter sp.]|uniref:MgtC/SapB family protein n=1 Tax=Mizugakiibacter sp. TaxID=1972610 RepID=UPI0031C03FC3|nr:DUF4010 domain-containing protein [Xanthomonadaceae bacterium]